MPRLRTYTNWCLMTQSKAFTDVAEMVFMGEFSWSALPPW